jgi:hypothetical protein
MPVRIDASNFHQHTEPAPLTAERGCDVGCGGAGAASGGVGRYAPMYNFRRLGWGRRHASGGVGKGTAAPASRW